MCEMSCVDDQGGFLTASCLCRHQEAPAGGPIFSLQNRGRCGGALSCYLYQVREENLQRRCDSAIRRGSGFAPPPQGQSAFFGWGGEDSRGWVSFWKVISRFLRKTASAET